MAFMDFFKDKQNLAIVAVGLLILAFTAYAMTGMLTATPNPGNQTKWSTFTDNGKAIELQDGKPVIRMFSTTWCPHCKWAGPTYDKVVKEYVDAGKIVAYHWELDTKDNILTDAVETSVPQHELDIFSESNKKGSIPTYVFGGRYVRIGNGFETTKDLTAEENEFRAMIEQVLRDAGK